MERLLAIWCPDLLEEQESGRQARAFGRVLEAVGAFSPAVEAVRPGVCAVPTKGPSRYFGGDEVLAHQVAAALAEVDGTEGAGVGDTGKKTLGTGVGVADGLFAAVLAARYARTGPVVVASGGTPAFLSPWPVDTLDRPELADLLHRLGVSTLGHFAALPAQHVLARLDTEAATCHRVAQGIDGELPGLRAGGRWEQEAGGTRTGGSVSIRQPGFWGGAAGADARAEKAVARVHHLLHAEAVVVGRLQGGRGPGERARLVPWVGHRPTGTSVGTGTTVATGTSVGTVGTGPSDHGPWPGQVPPPAPVVVLTRPLPAVLADNTGHPIGVTGAGMATTTPAHLSVAGGRWAEVVAWAGPWPADERWWSTRGHRRRARMQVVTAGGTAYLLALERGRWWLEGAYD
ncbi:MAG: hypothetical protein ACYDD6_07335 [Acidimicrobiales bacterium]